MKNIIIILGILFLFIDLNAQTVKFNEDFENLPINFNSVGTTTWDRSSTLQVSGVYSDSVRIVSPGDSARLISTSFSTTNYQFVYLEFDHICKIPFTNSGLLHVSADSGLTWIPLTSVEYKGSSYYEVLEDRFTAASYTDWMPSSNSALPQNSWWKHEMFEVSSLVSDTANVMVRFKIRDDFSSGGWGNYGWLIDNVKVIVSHYELEPPTVELLQPIIKDTAYYTGPYEISAKMFDASGIDTAYILYTYNGITDSVGMGIISYDTSNFQHRKGVIPSLPFNSSFSYQVVVIDSSGSTNITRIPTHGFQQVAIVRPYDELNIGLVGNKGFMAPLFNDSIDDSRKYSQHISLIKANELKFREADFIKLAWNKTDSAGYLGNNAQLKIYVKHTISDTVDVAPGSFANAKSGATLVYDSTGIILPIIGKWFDFEFNVDTFHYDGNQNLLVLVEWYRPDTLTNSKLTWQYSHFSDRAVTFAGSTANPTTAYALGQLPNIKIYSIPTIYNYDIGVSKIVNPEIHHIGNTAQDITVRIKNYGSETISKMNIHYKIDGQATQTYPWTGFLNKDISTNDIIIGTEAFVNGFHELTTWTNLPNDSVDMYTGNDTISRLFYVCTEQLDGAYTVGGSSADYQTFEEVENQLNMCGISGAVTFYINPGVYYENIHLIDVPGASSINTITFVSSTGNADDVRLINDAQTSDQAYVFKLEKISWVRIKNINARSINGLNSTIIILKDSSQNNIIQGCKFSTAAVTNGYSYGIKTEGSENSFNTISNNEFHNIGYSIYYDAEAKRSELNVIENNIFKNIKRTAILIQRNDKIKIVGNSIDADPSSYFIEAIKIRYSGDGFEISKNKIDIVTSDYAKGIKISDFVGTVDEPNTIANNFVSISGLSSDNNRICIELNTSNYTNLYYNSFALLSGGVYSKGVYIVSNSNIELANNIFSSFNNGSCFEVSLNGIGGGIVYSDYNSFYSNGAIYGKWGNSSLLSSAGVADLTSFSSMDSNSVFTDPLFYTNKNLHSFSSVLNGAANPINDVLTDIDNDIRDISSPDIGADEYALSSIDAGVVGLLSPLELDTQLNTINPQVIIRNFGSSPITSMQIKYQLNAGTIQNYNYTGNLAYSDIDTVSLPIMTIPVLDYKFTAYTQLVNDTINFNDSLVFNLYGMPLIDAKVIELISPVDGCGMDTNEVVKIKITNKGLTTISSGLTASYQLVGSSTIVTEPISVSLNPGAEMIYTFNTKADLSVSGQDSIFNIKIFVNHTADPIAINDTTYGDVLSLGILVAPTVSDTTINYGTSITLSAWSPYNIVWYEDDTSTMSLEYGTTYITPQLFDTTTYYVESNTNIPAMTKFLGDDITTNVAGASDCIYKGGGASHQILILASELQSMGIVAGDITSLSFYMESTSYATNHSQFTIKMGHTMATALTTSFITSGLNLVYQQSFTEAVGWNLHNFYTPFTWDGVSNVILDFVLYTDYGNPLIRYSGTSFNSIAYNVPYGGGTGVSNLRPNMRFTTSAVLGCAGTRAPITVNVPLAAIDANMSAIITPNQSCGLNTTTVECQIVNMGTDTIPAGCVVSYKVDNGAFIAPETINISIAPSDTLNYIFNTLANLTSGPIGTTYSITSVISTPNDFYTDNDTLTLTDIWSEYTPSAPIIAVVPTANYGDTVTIVASSADTIFWFSDDIATQQIGEGVSIPIGPIYDTTMVYAQAIKTVPLSPFEIGNGTALNTSSNGPSPYGASSYTAWGLRNQFLIHATELRAMGMLKGEIESLSFYVNTASGGGYSNFTVKIGTTNLTELSTFETALTTIYSNGYSEVVGWNTYTFNTPYNWDGVSNVVIETCFKNTAWVTTGYAIAPYTNTSYVSSLTSFSGSNFSCSDVIIDAAYSKRPNIKFTAKGYGSCPSPIVSQQINVQGIPATDVGLMNIISPIGNVSSNAPVAIKVLLKNYGTNTLNSVSINWMGRDGVTHTFPWTGTLPSGDTTSITIGNHMFMGGQTRLYTWTSMPNSIVDLIALNDSAYTDLIVCMQGNYTIGSGMDYPTLQESIDDMVISTICGPIVLDIDTGIYNGKYVLPSIIGLSASQPLIIKSISNDSSVVHLTANTSIQENYVLKLLDAPYVTIKGITFNANGNSYSNAVVLSGNTRYVNIENCVFNSSTNPIGIALASGVYSEDAGVEYISIDNNLFNNGYQSLFFKGSFSDRQKGISITNNKMTGYAKDGVFVDYQDSLTVSGNDISSGIVGTIVYGIHIRNTQNSLIIRNNKIIITPVTSGFGISIQGIDALSNYPSVIANNMITIDNGSDVAYGLKLNNFTNLDVVFNSVNILNGTTNNKACFVQLGSGLKILNNVFYTYKGRLLDVANPFSLISCDYNNYYTDTINNQYFVKWVNDVSSLNDLKTIDPNANVHSISVDPSFYSNINLHSYEMQLKAAAIPVSHTLVDFDNEPRNSTTPDIGADEFILSPIDLGTVGLSHPNNSGCGFTSSDSIVVNIRNYGTSTINFVNTPAIIRFYSTGVNPDTILYTVNAGAIASGGFMGVKITNNFNLAITGLYIFDAEISITGDGNTMNDNMNTQEFIYYQAISNFPFNEDFESGSSLYLGSNAGIETQMAIVSAAAASGTYGMRYTGGDNSNFTPNSTVEDVYSHSDHIASLYSCQIDASNINSLNLRFDLKQTYRTNVNESWFRVIIIDQNGAHYAKNINGDSTFRPNTQSNDPFTTHTFVLNDYVGQNFSLYLEGALGSSMSASGHADIAYIDNISIWSPVNIDVSLKAVSSFAVGFLEEGTVHHPMIAIENFGATIITSLPISYSINGQAPLWDTLAVSIGVAESDTITMNASIVIQSGDQELSIIAHLPNDMEASNDTLRDNIKGLDVFGLNYVDDFEGNDNWYGIGEKSQWQLGTPSSTNFTSAYSGSNAYVTELAGDYQIEATEYLYSPFFQIPNTTDTATFGFMHKMQVVPQQAYGYIQYSINGQMWLYLGYIGDPKSNNWYTLNTNGVHAWSNQTNNWINSWIKLDPATFNTGGKVQFRFVFQSLPTAQVSDGWMIDDFSIVLPQQQLDAGVQQIILPDTNSEATTATTVEILIHNYGYDTLSQIDIAYKVDGMSEVNETWLGTLLPDSSIGYTFNIQYISPIADYNLCAYTKLSGDINTSNDGKCKALKVVAPDWDASVVSIEEEYAVGGNIIKITVTNLGANQISQLPVSFSYGLFQSNVENINGVIDNGDTVAYNFSQTAPFSSQVILCGQTILPSDMVPSNDESCITTTSVSDIDNNEFTLNQNKPNPFDNNTIISYKIPRGGNVHLRVINMLGDVVFQEEHKSVAGEFSKEFNFSSLNPGIYYYSIVFEGRRLTKKMIIY